MKYIDADKIRAEIERLMDEYKPMASVDELTGSHIALAKLHSFLDTLEEPVSDCHGLEEVAKKYADLNCHNHVENETDWNGLLYAFKAGAEWAMEKLKEDKQ